MAREITNDDAVYELLVDIACDLMEDGRELVDSLKAEEAYWGPRDQQNKDEIAAQLGMERIVLDTMDLACDAEMAFIEADLNLVNACIAAWIQ